MPDNIINVNIGKRGEFLAKEFLKTKGYEILDMNFRTLHGEIDIIAETEQCLIFVEVKTRTNFSFGPIINQIPIKKINRIQKTAEDYRVRKQMCDKDCRIDVICVYMDGDTLEKYHIEHIENVFITI